MLLKGSLSLSLFVSKIKSHCLKEGMFDGAGIIGLITVQGAYLEEETGRGAREGVDKSSDGITHDHESVTYMRISAFLSPCIIYNHQNILLTGNINEPE